MLFFKFSNKIAIAYLKNVYFEKTDLIIPTPHLLSISFSYLKSMIPKFDLKLLSTFLECFIASSLELNRSYIIVSVQISEYTVFSLFPESRIIYTKSGLPDYGPRSRQMETRLKTAVILNQTYETYAQGRKIIISIAFWFLTVLKNDNDVSVGTRKAAK